MVAGVSQIGPLKVNEKIICDIVFLVADWCRDILVALSMVDTPAIYHMCGSIEGQVEGIQNVNCYKPMSARFVKINSTSYRIDVYEIEVIGH